MKITVNTNELKKVIGKMEKLTVKSAVKPLYSIIAIDDRVEIKTSNYNNIVLTGLVSCDYLETNKGFMIQVEKKAMEKVVKNFTDSETTFEVNNDKVFISSGKKMLKTKDLLQTSDKINFKDFLQELYVELPQNFTNEVFKHIKYALKKDDKPILNAVSLQPTGIYTTDSYRACVTEMELVNRELNVPVAAIELVKKMKEKIVAIRYSMNESDKRFNYNWIAFELENSLKMDVCLIEGKYPDMTRLLKIETCDDFKFNTKDLIKTLKSVKSMSSDGRKVLDFDFFKLECKTQNEGNIYLESIDDCMTEKRTADFVSGIAFDADYLLDSLDHMEEKVTFSLAKATKPFYVRDNTPTYSFICPCHRMEY